MPQRRKNVKRFKPVHIDSWLLLKKSKPVQTGPHRFKAFAQKRRTPLQTGSHRFMAFAQKNINRFKSVQMDLKTLARENVTKT